MNFSSIDTIWILIAAALVFFMQAGFAMLEAGLTRAKNTGNILMKNLMDFAIGTIVFWILGFGIMFGDDIAGIIGKPDLFVTGDYSGSYPTLAFLIFQTVFCATVATIVSGAMAERTKFLSYCLYSAVISIIIYPISGHWIWGGGWLAKLGFHDFAGGTAVHMVGGVAALAGARILGARMGKYDKNGKPKALLGHNMALAALGVFILWFGWFGFNGGSTLGATGDSMLTTLSSVFVNTNLSAAAAACVVMILTWVKYKKPDISMTFNGALAGLVAITTGCDAVDTTGALAIGIISGIAVLYGIEFIDKKLKIDDPVGAIGVHGICGALGTVLIGIFATEGGLLYGGGFKLLGIQALGVTAVALYVGVAMTAVFLAIKYTVGLRVNKEEELSGLDISEHGLLTSFAGFSTTAPADCYEDNILPPADDTGNTSNISVDKNKYTKIVIVTKQTMFEKLKTAMGTIGVTGMTVTSVLGCGIQKGAKEMYRGTPVEINLLPKIKVGIVVSKIPVKKVIDTAKSVLYTGNIGDGKIFVYDVENVVKIRTGEEGFNALQDENIC